MTLNNLTLKHHTLRRERVLRRLTELARSWRSVRKFHHNPIPIEDLRYILEAAGSAPSGANRQPWRFLVVLSRERKEVIRRMCEEVERRFHEAAPENLRS